MVWIVEDYNSRIKTENPDPNSNRMFREDMGTTNSGCKCQTQWIFHWENGEIINDDLISDSPCHLRNKQTEELWLSYYVECKRIKANGKYYYKVPCESLSDNMWCYKDEIAKEYLTDKPNGTYVFDVEIACYSTYCWDYGCYEGDGEYAVILLNQEPLTEETIDKFLQDYYVGIVEVALKEGIYHMLNESEKI